MNSTATLAQMLPAKVRAVIYGVVSAIGLALMAAQAGYSAIHTDQPPWLVFSWAVYAALGFGSGVLAVTNVTPTPKPEPEPEPDGEDLMDQADDGR